MLRCTQALFVSPEAGILLLIYQLFQESFDGWMAVHEPQSSSPFSRSLISFASLSVSPPPSPLRSLSRRGFLPRPSLQQDASRCLWQSLCAPALGRALFHLFSPQHLILVSGKRPGMQLHPRPQHQCTIQLSVSTAGAARPSRDARSRLHGASPLRGPCRGRSLRFRSGWQQA